jgi:tetratricopeptide (TPR) repeat protein
VAAKRAHFFEQQNQSRLLDDICQELLWLLRRHNRQPQSCRRRDYVELLQFQASCVGMAQHKPTPACATPGDGKTSPTGSQGQQLKAQADETTVWPMAPDQTTRPQQREFEFKGLRLVKDDGFWVQLESSDGRRQWAREQQGWPWVQPGQPLRYRLLELVHASSLHHRMEGGWQEHRWKEGMQATGESRAYFNQLTHAVTWRKPAALQFLPIIEPAAASQGARGSKASGQGGKPRPKAPSVGLLKPQSQSALTATLVDMLREPNPHNGQSVLAVAGFALLLVQGGMFAQALPALRRAVALCLAEEDQEREKEHKAALAAQEDGSSEGEEDGDGTGKKKKPRMPSAASKAAVLRAARQRAMLCLALSRLCLLTGDFRTAEETARLTASKAASDASVLCGVGDVLMHLCRRDEAEHVLLASLLLDPQSQPTFRAYARLCAARGQAEFADSYYRRAVAACNDTQALEKPNYREAAETCLEYACYLLEPWERKVPEAERLLRQALGWLTTRGQPQGFGLAYAPPPPERPDTDVDSHLMADICFALGRLYHLHRRDGSHATAYYRQACKLRPNYYAALLHHACLLATSRRTDDHRDADGLFRRALSLPEASTPHARLLPPLLYAHFLAATLGDTAQAESECVAAMASGSALAVPLVALSSMLSHLPHPTTATRMLCRRLNRRLSQLYPRDPVALVALGMALLQETSEPTPESSGPLPALTELREEALACFDEALRLTNGRFAPALRGKGLLMSQGPDKDTTAALELFLQGLSVMPESVALLRTTAMHLLTHMPLLGAVCPAATPKAPQTRNNRPQKSGEEEEISGDYTEARHQVVAYLSRALSLEPNDASTLATLALVTLRVQPQEAATAERLLHRGVQASILAADKGRCLRLLGHLAYDRGVNVQAAEAFHAALQVCPTDTVAAVGLAACLAASCDGVQVDKPEMQFQAAWANGPPASSYCHLMYGVFKLKMRYDRAAARDLFLFAARDKKRPPNCLALYYLGRIAMMGNKLKEMEKWMVFAIETEPLGFLQVRARKLDCLSNIKARFHVCFGVPK